MKLPRVCTLTFIFLLVVPVVFAQGAVEVAAYDATKEMTVRGTVTEVVTIDCPKGQKGTRLTLQTEDKTFDVHVGPEAWLAKLEFKIKAGEKMEITGAMGPCAGKDVLKARQLTKGNVTISVRSKRGDPLWERTWTG